MKKFFSAAAWLLVLFSALALAGCGKKPPECADEAAAKSLRNFMNDSVVEGARILGIDVRKDTAGVIAKYLSSWTFDLSNVTSQGYDEKSRTRSCAGKVTITIPDTKQTGYVDVAYTMQTLEDGKSGDFQLKVGKNYQQWAYGAATPAVKFYRDTTTAGVWTGVSQCGPTELRTQSLGAVSSEEFGQGYSVESTSGVWAADGSSQPSIELSVSGGKAVMNIAAGGKTLSRSTDLGEKGTLVFPSRDEFESLVPGVGAIAEGAFVQPDASGPNVAVRAKVKSNATGNVSDVVLVRSCVLKLAKK
jgi:hypothetical protein